MEASDERTATISYVKLGNVTQLTDRLGRLAGISEDRRQPLHAGRHWTMTDQQALAD